MTVKRALYTVLIIIGFLSMMIFWGTIFEIEDRDKIRTIRPVVTGK